MSFCVINFSFIADLLFPVVVSEFKFLTWKEDADLALNEYVEYVML